MLGFFAEYAKEMVHSANGIWHLGMPYVECGQGVQGDDL